MLKFDFALNDQVLDMIVIPASSMKGGLGELTTIMEKGRKLKQTEDEDPDQVPYPTYLHTDFLFVLTKGLHCLLLAFNKDK